MRAHAITSFLLACVSQGVVAFLQGDSGKASGLLIRASAEAKSLKPDPALASRLMQQWHTVKLEVLRPQVSTDYARFYAWFALSYIGSRGRKKERCCSVALISIKALIDCCAIGFVFLCVDDLVFCPLCALLVGGSAGLAGGPEQPRRCLAVPGELAPAKGGKKKAKARFMQKHVATLYTIPRSRTCLR